MKPLRFVGALSSFFCVILDGGDALAARSWLQEGNITLALYLWNLGSVQCPEQYCEEVIR